MQTAIDMHEPNIARRPATMRTALLAAAVAALLPVNAADAQRPNTQNMSCAQARSVVASAGSIVLSTGVHTFDKYVVSPGFCSFGEYAYDATVPTVDTRNCRIGYRCDSNPPLWDNGIYPRGPAWR
jgi:hypothetical protein